MNSYLNISYLTYDVDDVIKNNVNLLNNKNILNEEIQKNIKSQSNYLTKDVLYLDSFHAANGVSGSAFQNVQTGEIVIGFTGTNEWKDWENNILGTGLGLYDYMQPAHTFYESIRNRYGDNVVLTGHSQGGAIAQHVAIEYNVPKTIVFNASPVYTKLSMNVLVGVDIETKIKNFNGRVLRFTSDGDVLNNITQSIIVDGRYVGDEYTLKGAGWHMLDSMTNSPKIIANIEQITQTYFGVPGILDFNDDNLADVNMKIANRGFQNLLTIEYGRTNGQNIVVNPDVLNTLATNLLVRIDEDIAQINTICQSCIEKNDNINKDFESRKQQMSESIIEVFQSAGFPFLLHQLNNSIDTIMTHQSVLERGMAYAQMQYPFSSHQTPLINGGRLELAIYNIQLAKLSRACQPLLTQIKQDKTHTISNFFIGEQTLLGSWQIIESATDHLIRKSDEIFEGEGLRLGKKDGISDALTEVLKTIKDNTDELAQSLLNAVELVNGIAINFQQADEWLGVQLQNGGLIGETPAPRVAPHYTAYLERNPLLDDVKDVLQAFDRQVEQKSRQYAREVANVYSTSMGTFEQGLDRWKNLSEDLEAVVSQIVSNYDQAIYVKEEKITHKQIGEEHIKEITYPIRYWGTLEQLYPGDVREVIYQLKQQILPKKDIIQQAIWQSERVKNQLQNLEATFKPIVEEGVYRAFDLDEIIQGQKTVLQIANRLKQEITHVVQTIVGEGMQAQSVEILQRKLQDTQRLIGYYAKFVGDCFGDNEMSGVHTTPSASTRFSLNIPIAYK